MNDKKPVRFINWIVKQKITPAQKGDLMELSREYNLKILRKIVRYLMEGKDLEESKKLSINNNNHVKI